LLTQVVGRAGRGETAGEAIIQTLYPEHYSIQLACRQDYPAFFDRELEFRRAMRYPPVVALVNGVVRGPTHDEAMAAAGELVARLRTRQGSAAFDVLGPAPAPLARLRGEHRAQFFVKGQPHRGPSCGRRCSTRSASGRTQAEDHDRRRSDQRIVSVPDSPTSAG